MHRIAAVVSAVVAVVLLTACARQPGGVPAPGVPAPSGNITGPQPDPLTLLGSWTLAEVTEDAGAIVTVEPGNLSIRGSCGTLTGSWQADVRGLFIGHVYGASGCRLPTEPGPGWLVRAAAFRPDGADRLLVAPDGTATARLRPTASPPTITQQQRERYRAPAALPGDLVPAGRPALIGRWLPAASTGRPYLELRADGTWNGSDGCNGQRGRWMAGAGGALLATHGPSTLIFCDGVPVGAWMAQARRTGLFGQVLVLLDVDGTEIGRLRRGG